MEEKIAQGIYIGSDQKTLSPIVNLKKMRLI